MKIAFVVHEFPVLSQTFILDQITGLIDLGVEVRIFAESGDGLEKIHPDMKKYHLKDLTCYTCDIPKSKVYRLLKGIQLICRATSRRPFRTIKFLARLILNSHKSPPLRLLCWIDSIYGKNFDVIHCHFAPVGLYAVALKEFGIRARLITTFHGYDVNRDVLTGVDNLYKPLIDRGDHFTSNTNYTRDQAIKLGFDGSKITILPVGLNVDKFTFKHRHLLPGDTINILTVGRLVEKKGHRYMLRALAKMIPQYSNINYMIAGDGPLSGQLRALTKELGLDENVTFLGALDQDQVVSAYQEAHLFVLSCATADDGDKEGQALVLQEAQAVGLPVISTLHNGIPDGVLDGESGFLVPEKDVEALAERLGYLIENPHKWAQMGQCGRDFVCENYDIGKLNQRLLDLYKKILLL